MDGLFHPSLFYIIHTDMNEEILHFSEHYTEYEPQCPIVIPSYQNREGTILSDLKSLSNNKIMLFIYDTDYDLYKQYLVNPNVEIVTINETWRSIQKKRHWIQNYLANNRPEIENYIMIDDDIKKAKVTCYKEDGHITSKYIPIMHALGILEHLHKKYSNTVSGGAGVNTGILSGKVLNKNKYFYQVFCFNNRWLKDNPQCMFRDMQNVSEDNIVWYDCYNNNQPYYSFECIYFDCAVTKSYKSIASTPLNRMKNDINALRIMKHNCKLHWSNAVGWECWAVRFIPGFVQTTKIWNDVKAILDDNMPGWEDISTNYSDDVFRQTFDKLGTYLKPLFVEDTEVSSMNEFIE